MTVDRSIEAIELSEGSDLTRVLSQWQAIYREANQREQEWSESHGLTFTPDMIRNRDELVSQMMAEAAGFIGYFEHDNSHRSATHLIEIADRVSPGGAHTGGLLVRLILQMFPFADPALIVATIYRNWHGGKAGFQFLPDPAEVDLPEYDDAAYELLSVFDGWFDYEPRKILIDEDLTFFERLPERFTVYRGCSGISVEKAALGLCWTTDRATAEWFAHRYASTLKPPLLLTARVDKRSVLLTNASENEVVLQPRKARVLKVGPEKVHAPWHKSTTQVKA